MQKIRFGVAGLGRIGWFFHCEQIAAREDCELAAVAERDEARRLEASAKYGCRAFADFEEMIHSGLVDAVAIATPTHLHESMSCAALRAGLDVVLEKPMAPDLASAERIAVVVKETGRLLTVYQPHRLMAYFQHIRKIVESGAIGKVTGVQRASLSYARRNDWQSLKKYGGGMLNNYGAHFLDQMLQLTGYDVERIHCVLQKVATLGDADDVVKVLFATKGGVFADLLISQAAISVPYEFVVWGTHGTLEKQGNNLKLRNFDPDKLKGKSLDESLASANREYPSDAPEVHEELIPVDPSLEVDFYADFLHALRTGSQPVTPLAQTLAVMRLLAKCREDAGTEADMR